MKTTSIYNFGAGPACLPAPVLSQIKDDIPDWHEGMSVMEISHRLPIFMELTKSIEADLREILKIPDDFAVLFMHGGARTQFSAVPLNLLHGANTA
ncbi:MAG: aminotransferase class V-fold PLP-dependent enzyme, partial [Candidatus Berkiella sp.]